MDNLMLHYDFLKLLMKSKLKSYKDLIVKATSDQLKAVTYSIHTYANKASIKEKKLLLLINSKRLNPKKLIQLLIKHRALIQSILCVAFQILLRMTSFAIVENGGC